MIQDPAVNPLSAEMDSVEELFATKPSAPLEAVTLAVFSNNPPLVTVVVMVNVRSSPTAKLPTVHIPVLGSKVPLSVVFPM